ncbi:hypothetical protein QYF50_07160 [Paenibacillus vini]|uniref:hypothetical protein n=1 Tax=Paenibacillus vini TaxID=1476024 RepID=UPI0025B713EB|nr:hypothetical protein [Paenibacillus vini]MDN4067670.1 hypothetical protein [Paenibacillus vini]
MFTTSSDGLIKHQGAQIGTIKKMDKLWIAKSIDGSISTKGMMKRVALESFYNQYARQ